VEKKRARIFWEGAPKGDQSWQSPKNPKIFVEKTFKRVLGGATKEKEYPSPQKGLIFGKSATTELGGGKTVPPRVDTEGKICRRKNGKTGIKGLPVFSGGTKEV